MSLDEKKWQQYYDQYPEVSECIGQAKTLSNALPCYEHLFRLKSTIPKELYAFYFRKILQFNTANVPNELRLKMFEGIDPEDIMYQDELDEIKNNFDEQLTVYRGTSKAENVPGICWTRYKHVAEGTFYNGRLFEATIPKSSILLYFAHDCTEGEIIAHVTSGYKIIEEEEE